MSPGKFLREVALLWATLSSAYDDDQVSSNHFVFYRSLLYLRGFVPIKRAGRTSGSRSKATSFRHRDVIGVHRGLYFLCMPHALRSAFFGVRDGPVFATVRHTFILLNQGFPPDALRRIILTASGGAFRDWPKEDLAKVGAKHRF